MSGELLHDFDLFESEFFVVGGLKGNDFDSVQLFGVGFVVALFDDSRAAGADDLVEYTELVGTAGDEFQFDVGEHIEVVYFIIIKRRLQGEIKGVRQKQRKRSKREWCGEETKKSF